MNFFNILVYVKSYPDIIPVFPLGGVIYFPRTNLPLNIFEERYLNLVNDAYARDKLMGMIQTKRENNEVYNVGCLGKISDYQKSADGRILINLTGIIRFKILNEQKKTKLYREFKVTYESFENDLNEEVLETNSSNLMEKVKIFFKKNGILLNWKELEKLDSQQKINTLSMIAPISNEEKQKLLEALTIKDKIETLENILSFYLHEGSFNTKTVQ